MHSIIGYYKEQLGTHTFLEMQILGLYVCIIPLHAWENERAWVTGLCFTLLPLIPSFGASSPAELTWGHVPVPWLSAPLSRVLQSGTDRDKNAPGRDRAAFRGALPSRGILGEATPCLVHFWEGRKMKAACKNTTLKFNFFFLNNHLSV